MFLALISLGFGFSFTWAEPAKSFTTGYENCKGSYLKCAREKADRDLKRVNEQIQKAAASGLKDLCAADLLRLERENAEWFLRHYADFERYEQLFKASVAEANQQLKGIFLESVKVVPEKRQDAEQIEISVSKLATYFHDFNLRNKRCTAAQKELFLQLQDDPTMTGFGISHRQALTTMKLLSQQLNSSLKVLKATYEIEFEEEGCGYVFQLKASMPIEPEGKTLSWTFPLWNPKAAIHFSEHDQWSKIQGAGLVLENRSIDGCERLQTLQEYMRDSSCKLTNWAVFKAGDAGAPYVSYSDAYLKKYMPEKVTQQKEEEKDRGDRESNSTGNHVVVGVPSNGGDTMTYRLLSATSRSVNVILPTAVTSLSIQGGVGDISLSNGGNVSSMAIQVEREYEEEAPLVVSGIHSGHIKIVVKGDVSLSLSMNWKRVSTLSFTSSRGSLDMEGEVISAPALKVFNAVVEIGDIEIGGLHAPNATLNIRETSGDLSVMGSTLKEIKFKNSSGNSDFESVEGKINGTSIRGDISLDSCKGVGKVHSESGEVTREGQDEE